MPHAIRFTSASESMLIMEMSLVLLLATKATLPSGRKTTPPGQQTAFTELFDYAGDPDQVLLDFAGSRVWVHSGVTAIAKVIHRYRAQGKEVSLTGLDDESQALINRVGLAAPSH